jgi:hypothetical protein
MSCESEAFMRRNGESERIARGHRLGALGTVVALAALLSGCDEFTGPTPPGDSRSFVMGFTDFPHANSVEALDEAWNVIERDGDLAVIHFDDGIPWQEALDGAAYPAAYQAELGFKAERIPAGHAVYLAVTPISPTRDGLALRRGDTGNEPLEFPWSVRSFNDPEVIAAFTGHCERMIDFFEPDYFAYAIEANMLAALEPTSWDRFLTLAQAVKSNLATFRPELPVFITIQAETYHGAPITQSSLIFAALAYSDVIAVSAYPYSRPLPEPDALAPDYFSEIADLAPAKPFAIAETAWPAEEVESPYPITIFANETTQRLYVTRLLEDCARLDALFVTWFFTRDFDEFWESELKNSPDADLIRLWRDTGLFDGNGIGRPALTVWRQALARGRG